MRMAGVVLIGLTCAAQRNIGQTVAPEIILYSRIRTHAQDQQAHLPDYTCLETINRFHRDSATAPLRPLDTVRLEVIYSNRREWFGAPGGRGMNTSSPKEFVGSGLIGSGIFASALHNILGGAQFTYFGNTVLGDRDAVRYDVHFSPQPPAFGINMRGGSGNIGEQGSLWADRDSLNLLRLDLHAADVPGYLPLAAQDITVNYAQVRIGGTTALLPNDAGMSLIYTTGDGDFDHLDFTHCRAYGAESTISFDTPPPENAAVSAKKAADKPANVPALLKLTIALTTPVSNTDAVGSLIEGKVVGNVVSRGKVAIADGAIIHGRIRRLEHYQGNDNEFIVGLEFTELEASAGLQPFYADLLSIDRAPQVRIVLKEEVAAGEAKITLPELPGVASFFVEGKSFRLPENFQTVWRTRGPIRGIE